MASNREVARMVGKRHDHLLRDIGRYIKVLDKSGELKVEPSAFFCESEYNLSVAYKAESTNGQPEETIKLNGQQARIL